MSRLWDKGKPIDEIILQFTVGQDYVLDARLVPFDIQASIAHVQMLQSCGHLTEAEGSELCQCLAEVGADFEAGKWKIELEQEDCHTAIEAQMIARLGELGGKVHLGRSRNDQVLTALRLFLKSAITEIRDRMSLLDSSFHRLIQEQGNIQVPGYTHLQQAMPSSVALWASGFQSELASNAAFLDTAYLLADQNPLGSAAGYGTPGLTLDRQHTTGSLGFAEVQEPVTACQLSRGKAESALVFAILHVLNDLGRMAADVCLFASQEFGYVSLADEVSTGSSIMPQKRNPDVFELIRAHSSQVQGELLAILNLISKMSSGYHRDLQLMKEPLFRAIDRAILVIDVSAYAIGKITFNSERAAAVTDPSIHAAEEAFKLVQNEGISFREAYRRIAAGRSQANDISAP